MSLNAVQLFSPRQATASQALTPLVTSHLLLLSGVLLPRLCPAALRQPRTCQQVPQASQEIQRHLAPRGALQCRSSSLLCASGGHRRPAEASRPTQGGPSSSRRQPAAGSLTSRLSAALTSTRLHHRGHEDRKGRGPIRPPRAPSTKGGDPPDYPPAPGTSKPPGASQLEELQPPKRACPSMPHCAAGPHPPNEELRRQPQQRTSTAANAAPRAS
ncbi:hypothetical protein NDU88_005411 [Pleurodeles waltl]|uniref:Uncharacterized protein n=1 Tax=Pleurodeles waltl TaxID=8319 RepID=A0AAV7QF79_PLEWA|nr:hypothetical protein NDU88_005411 [Pleurodeles waltl]